MGFVLLLLIAGVVVPLALIFRKDAKADRAAAPPPGIPIDEATRKRRLRSIRYAKMGIAALAVLLVLGFARGGLVLPSIVGAMVNLCIMAALIVMVVRLKKSLK